LFAGIIIQIFQNIVTKRATVELRCPLLVDFGFANRQVVAISLNPNGTALSLS
jgi:hypothetical protein